MTNHINNTKSWFEAAVPNPTDKNRAVQIGCHYEEVVEMAEALGESSTYRSGEFIGLEQAATRYKKDHAGIEPHKVNRLELLDALCDQIVTAVGVAHMFGMNIEGAMAEVNRSNFSKFVDGKPMFNEHGKIAKGPNYTPPDLTGFY